MKRIITGISMISAFAVISALTVISASLGSCSQDRKQGEHPKTGKLPNIILMMGDDIGFSDLGCYGSEIKTPHLDQLAQKGLRFRTFYNAAKCNPTRSTLLTGMYVGNSDVVNIASVLSENGYTTIHTGKEHFDKWVPEHCYAENVFDYSFHYWAINQYHIPPDSIFQQPFYLNGRELKIAEINTHGKPFYKTDVVTDYALQFIDSALQEENPFFLYLPFHAAHYPLQAMPEDIAKYRGKYRAGWDEIRRQRYEKMMEMGIITDAYALSEPTDNINKFRGHPGGDEEIRANIPVYRPWESLSAQEKDDLDLEMAVFAAMIDRMDQNIGRVIEKLKEEGQFENTIIMYLSDNGSCPYDSNRDFEVPPGPADSYRTLCAAWANAGNTPFRYFKQFGHEGGSRTHFIVHWPGYIEGNSITDQPGHIVDLFPTLLDIAGAEYPDSLNGIAPAPLHGSTLLPVFLGDERETPEFFISGFLERFRMFRSGDWKIVRSNNEQWELYNMKDDPSETNDLSAVHPGKLQEMIDKYKAAKSVVIEGEQTSL